MCSLETSFGGMTQGYLVRVPEDAVHALRVWSSRPGPDRQPGASTRPSEHREQLGNVPQGTCPQALHSAGTREGRLAPSSPPLSYLFPGDLSSPLSPSISTNTPHASSPSVHSHPNGEALSSLVPVSVSPSSRSLGKQPLQSLFDKKDETSCILCCI